MKMKPTILAALFLASLVVADEDLLKPVGISIVGDSDLVEAAGGHQKISRDSLFPFIERLERSFENSRPFYGKYYFWTGTCGQVNYQKIKIEVKKRRIGNLLVGCLDPKGKVMLMTRIIGRVKIDTWEKSYLEKLGKIQVNPQ